MASYTLYPPIMDSAMSAFIYTGPCRVYFSLSQFTSSLLVGHAHARIIKQTSGANVVELNNLGYTGILLNLIVNPVEDRKNLYYVDINPECIKGGWEMGTIYKIQLRLVYAATGAAPTETPEKQSTWLSANADSFSEWSTMTAVKAIGAPVIKLPPLKYDSSEQQDNIVEKTLGLSLLDIVGSYENEDVTEPLSEYRLRLFLKNNIVIENEKEAYDKSEKVSDSGILFSESTNLIKYNFPIELTENTNYVLLLDYVTKYGYSDSIPISFTSEKTNIDLTPMILYTVDNDDSLSSKRGKVYEEEEGIIRLFLNYTSNDNSHLNHNYRIKRRSSKDNFTEWTDFKIFYFSQEDFIEDKVFIDYTIESGIYYQYGIQLYDSDQEIGDLNIYPKKVMRKFEHSYLLGENNKQLKLKFNNEMNNYRINISESHFDVLGDKFPVFTRNGHIYYQTFPITGLISFNMDENDFFIDKDFLEYKYITDTFSGGGDQHPVEIDGVRQLVPSGHQLPIKHINVDLYDKTYEREFRKRVLEFLYDGKPKLYKSPTEGNILVRLGEVSCTPDQSLSRLIYSFSSTAYEVGEPIMQNFVQYGLHTPGTRKENLAIEQTFLGQLRIVRSGDIDIIKEIYDSFDHSSRPMAGESRALASISNLKIEFNTIPRKIELTSADGGTETVLGHEIIYDGQHIVSYHDEYDFDSILNFYPSSSVIIKARTESDMTDPNKKVTPETDLLINFTYQLSISPYKERSVATRQIRKGIGQLRKTFHKNESIYGELYSRYFFDGEMGESKVRHFRRLNNIVNLEIEANPGSRFSINGNEFTINATRTLVLDHIEKISSIYYLGNPSDENKENTYPEENYREDSESTEDMIFNYIYYVTEGTYGGGN